MKREELGILHGIIYETVETRMKKQNLGGAAKNLFLRIGVYDLLRRLRPNPAAAILRYHAVVDPKDNFYTSPSIALSPADFENHVQYFSSNYHLLSLDQTIDHLKQNQKFQSNGVAFTFDDGYADNLVAAKILHKYGANGTFYITTEPIERKSRFWVSELIALMLKTNRKDLNISLKSSKQEFAFDDLTSRWQTIREIIKVIKSNNKKTREKIRAQLLDQLGEPRLIEMIDDLMLNWGQIDEMKKMGMTIGSHTITHLNLPNADPTDAKVEIEKSKQILEAKLGVPVRHFSYPNSGPYEYYNDRIRAYVQDAGYESSTTSRQGYVNSDSDFFALERIRTVPTLAEIVHEMEWDRFFSR
jgi:peptidoglycan/xylan/chitin deacetylase (PgdA/CDA1 family)